MIWGLQAGSCIVTASVHCAFTCANYCACYIDHLWLTMITALIHKAVASIQTKTIPDLIGACMLNTNITSQFAPAQQQKKCLRPQRSKFQEAEHLHCSCLCNTTKHVMQFEIEWHLPCAFDCFDLKTGFEAASESIHSFIHSIWMEAIDQTA